MKKDISLPNVIVDVGDGVQKMFVSLWWMPQREETTVHYILLQGV